MIYLLDANVLITANRLYYPLDRVPGYWAWLLEQGQAGNIRIVDEIFEEFAGGTDALAVWTQSAEVRDALRLHETPDILLVRQVLDEGYATNLTDDELEQVGMDPFLIAHAKRHPDHRTVITLEQSKPSRQRANRHVPDVCDSVGVLWDDPFAMARALDFHL